MSVKKSLFVDWETNGIVCFFNLQFEELFSTLLCDIQICTHWFLADLKYEIEDDTI